MNKLKERLTASAISVLLSAAILLVLLAQSLIGTPVKEKPLGTSFSLGRDCSTNDSASTTPASLGNPGSATSTITCGLGSSNSLRVNAWLIASSTKTSYGILVARSNDGVDYYQEGGSLLSLNANATTTRLVNFSEFQYNFASSTKEDVINVNYGGRGTTTAKLITFEVPGKGANTIRLSAYLKEGDVDQTSTSSDSGMIWMEGVQAAR